MKDVATKLGMLLLVGVFVTATAGALGGCETMEGAGEDIENVGEEISD